MSMVSKQVLIKLERFCAYQERCHQEVANKAKLLQLDYQQTQLSLLHLIEHNFLNEERFVALYISSKINQKSWGLVKIQQELLKKGCSKNLIAKHLNHIAEEVFIAKAAALASKYIALKKLDLNIYSHKHKLLNNLLSKGYPFETINKVILSLS